MYLKIFKTILVIFIIMINYYYTDQNDSNSKLLSNYIHYLLHDDIKVVLVKKKYLNISVNPLVPGGQNIKNPPI